MTTLFISDLHLSPERPELVEAFLAFLKREGPDCKALYILGDFFEVWVGDDAMAAFEQPIVQALRELADQGTSVWLMHGNRDFMLGRAFCRAAGCRMLKDPALIELQGQRVLLTHGDTLCTRDASYQQKRWRLRNPLSVWILRHLPLKTRLDLARRLRQASRNYTRQQAMEIIDVTDEAVEQMMRRHRVRTLIHGHTHRPQIHEFSLDGAATRRIVLGDWNRQGWVLKAASSGDLKLEAFPIAPAEAEATENA